MITSAIFVVDESYWSGLNQVEENEIVAKAVEVCLATWTVMSRKDDTDP